MRPRDGMLDATRPRPLARDLAGARALATAIEGGALVHVEFLSLQVGCHWGAISHN